MSCDYCAEKQNWLLEIICLVPEFGAVAQEQGEFWQAHPGNAKLIAFKVIGRICGYTLSRGDQCRAGQELEPETRQIPAVSHPGAVSTCNFAAY